MMLATIAVALAAAGIVSPPQVRRLEETYGYPSSEEACAAFNREQAEFARRQLAENTERQKAQEEAVFRRQAFIRKQRNDYEMEKARLARQHEEELAKWRADVAACKAGDRSRCTRD